MRNCHEYMEKHTYFELPNPFHVFHKNGHAIQLGDVQSLKLRTIFCRIKLLKKPKNNLFLLSK